MLTPSLNRQGVVRQSRDIFETGRSNEQFEGMTRHEPGIWFFPLFRQRGAVLFVRKPGNDPNLNRILHYNRPAKRPWIKLTKMTVLRRDGDGMRSRPVTHAA